MSILSEEEVSFITESENAVEKRGRIIWMLGASTLPLYFVAKAILSGFRKDKFDDCQHLTLMNAVMWICFLIFFGMVNSQRKKYVTIIRKLRNNTGYSRMAKDKD